MSKYGIGSKLSFSNTTTRLEKSFMCFLSDVNQKIIKGEDYFKILSFVQKNQNEIGTKHESVSDRPVVVNVKNYLKRGIRFPVVITDEISRNIMELFNEIRDVEVNKELKENVGQSMENLYAKW